MTEVGALAHELLLATKTVQYRCRRLGIEMVRRLPAGAVEGHTVSHVTDIDADRLRAFYRDRLLSRAG